VRVLFAGSPEIAVPALATISARHHIVGVLTNPPSAKGRGLSLSCTPVADAAATFGVPILAPERLGPAERDAVAALKPDLLVVFAYGRIFGPKFMALFPWGGINAHPSLLPRWRGCAPIPYAIVHRDAVTGVSIQRVAPEMDSGDVLARQEIALNGTETTESLSALSATLGAELLAAVIDQLEAGTSQGEPQDESAATYCCALSKDSGMVDWSLAAVDIDARVRAYHPWPGAWTYLSGERLAIISSHPWQVDSTVVTAAAGSGAEPGMVISVDKSRGIMVQTGKGLLALMRLQLRGKKPMDYKDFANGARGLVGTRLGAG
jgi:methionyl-tRNA formyltransferase